MGKSMSSNPDSSTPATLPFIPAMQPKISQFMSLNLNFVLSRRKGYLVQRAVMMIK